MRASFLLLSAFLTAPGFAQLVINEVDYDQPGTDATEFLELKNVSDLPYPLSSLRVAMVNGEGGTPVIYRTYSAAWWPSLAPGDYFVLCGNSLATANCNDTLSPATNAIQNGATDAIVLLSMPDSTVIDQLSYEGTLPGYSEGDGTSAADDNVNTDRSIGRFPDGADSNDNDADFIVMCSTPGAANSDDISGCSVVTSVQERPAAPAFTVLSDPANALVWMRYDGPPAGDLTFEVFTLDGSLIATRTTGRTSWAWPTGGRQGCLLLVRASTAGTSVTKRIVLP